jgi:O-antigen/teichoic acid export membrane protein
MLRYVAGARAIGDADGVRRALGTGLRLGLLVSGAVSIILLVGADAIAARLELHGAAGALRIFALVPPFLGVLYIAIQATLAARVTRVNFAIRGLLEPTVLLVAGLTAWALGGQLRGLAVAHLVAAVATAALALRALRSVFTRDELHGVLRAPGVPGFNRFSLTMSVAEWLNVAYQRADFLILTAYVGAEGAAVYAATEFITRVIVNSRYAFDAIVAGVMAEALQVGDHERLRQNLQLTTRWVVTVSSLIVGVVIVLRHEILGGLYGAAYVSGAAAVVVLGVACFINASLGLTGWILIASGRSHLTLINNFFGAAFNVVASLVLVPRLGLLGAALAALGTIVIVQGAALVEARVLYRVLPFSGALWKPLAAALCAFVTEALVHAAIGATLVRVVAVTGSGVVVFVGVLLAAGLPEEERHLAGKSWSRARAVLRRSPPV